MPTKYYCSSCGVELLHRRKAVPGKGYIVDLIDPHECEGYAIKSNELESPTVLDIIDQLKPLGEAKIVGVETGRVTKKSGFFDTHKDERESAKSTAPKSLIDSIKNLQNQEVEDTE